MLLAAAIFLGTDTLSYSSSAGLPVYIMDTVMTNLVFWALVVVPGVDICWIILCMIIAHLILDGRRHKLRMGVVVLKVGWFGALVVGSLFVFVGFDQRGRQCQLLDWLTYPLSSLPVLTGVAFVWGLALLWFWFVVRRRK